MKGPAGQPTGGVFFHMDLRPTDAYKDFSTNLSYQITPF